MGAVSLQEDDQHFEEEKESDKMEEEFRRVFGEGTEEVVERDRQGGVGEETVRARASKAETVSSEREVEEHNFDHAVFRGWRQRCLNGRADSRRHVKKAKDEGVSPRVGMEYAYRHSEQEKEEEN